MKALSDILTRMLMLLLLMLAACTNDADEVTTPTIQEQYVTVRMNVPDMMVTASRAADGVIESIIALSFDENDQLLQVTDVSNLTSHTFTLSVPQGTSIIHFLANKPYDVEIPQSGTQEDVMCGLTTGDHDNLCYWGMAEYTGNGSLFVTLYRNMAKITLASDPEFPFEGDSLYIAGLDNANESGKLVPYKDGFAFDSNSEFTTIPDGVTQLDESPPGTNDKEYGGYGRFLYVFEHENSNYEDKGLFVICKIGDAFYKVALTSDGINPYKIIRNHEYIIYVSDVDDYQSDTYRSTTYYGTFDKDPINLEVREQAQVGITANPQSINMNGNNKSDLIVTMNVPNNGTLNTLSISAPGFTIKQNGNVLGEESYLGNNLNYSNTTIQYTFVPKTFGDNKQITFTGTGTDLKDVSETIRVNVEAYLLASATTGTTLYYDSDDTQTVSVNVEIPAGVETLNVSGADNFAVTSYDAEKLTDVGNGSYTVKNTSSTQNVLFTFTLNKENLSQTTGQRYIVFSDANNGANQSQEVTVNLVATPTVTITPTGNQTVTLNGSPLTVTMSVPYGKTLSSFSITASGLGISQNENTLTQDGNGVYSATNVSGSQSFTFTPTAAGTYTITFSGQGTDVNMPQDSTITLTVKEAPAGGTETVIWDEERVCETNNSWILLSPASGGTADLDSCRNYFVSGAILKVKFNYDEEGYPLTLQTTWGKTFEVTYTTVETDKYLTYTFIDSDFGGENGTNNVTYAGLKLNPENMAKVVVTEITITSPTNNTSSGGTTQ